MNTENMARFRELAATDSTFKSKVEEVYASASAGVAQGLAKIAREVGLEITAEDFQVEVAELNENELDKVAGGLLDDHRRAMYRFL